MAKIPPVWWANGRRTISDFCHAEAEKAPKFEMEAAREGPGAHPNAAREEEAG